MRARFWLENTLDGLREQSRDAEGQRETWIVPPGFNSVDRLARHAESFGQVRLGPSMRRAKLG
jgi:hypothetical protein